MSSRTECRDTHHEPSSDSKIPKNNIEETFGRRRKLIKSLLNLEAVNSVIQELMPEVDRNICYSSEYSDNFSNSTISQSVKNDQVRMEYPLYGGSIHTVYSQMMNEGMLKNRNAIADINAPFKRNRVMSSSLEKTFN